MGFLGEIWVSGYPRGWVGEWVGRWAWVGGLKILVQASEAGPSLMSSVMLIMPSTCGTPSFVGGCSQKNSCNLRRGVDAFPSRISVAATGWPLARNMHRLAGRDSLRDAASLAASLATVPRRVAGGRMAGRLLVCAQRWRTDAATGWSLLLLGSGTSAAATGWPLFLAGGSCGSCTGGGIEGDRAIGRPCGLGPFFGPESLEPKCLRRWHDVMMMMTMTA